MIGIVDYGLGNLASVAGAIRTLDHEPVVSAAADELARCEKLILPGVGAFGDGMRKLAERHLVDPLTQMVTRDQKPILGICLGAQLMAHNGTEFGRHEGLGWIAGEVVPLAPGDPALRVPHVGWNDLVRTGDSVLFQDLPETALFYFVHSYHLAMADRRTVVGECEYGGRFAAVLQKGRIYATQFHPEKSQRAGLTLLANFLARG